MECKHVFTMCRLCLRESESFINIFQVDEWFGYVAAEVISDLLQFQVSETDGYPHVVCSICLRKLTDFKEFKEQCQNSRHTYNNVFAADESLEEHPVDIVPSASIKSEPETGMKEVDTSTEVGKCSSAVTSQEYLGRHRKRTCSESDGPCARAEVGKMDVKVWRDCESPGERIDMLPDEDSDLNGEESCVIEMREGTIKRREEGKSIDANVDAILGDEGIVELKIESENETGERNERGEEVPLGVEEREGEHFSCHDCGKDFQEKDVLLRHLELHGYVINEESCVEERDSQVDANVNCGTKRETSDSLEKGSNGKLSDKVERVEGIATYVCGFCRKRFKERDDLEVHLIVHTGGKPFACNICGKRFIDTSGLTTHKFIHTGEKPYRCEVCGKQFDQRRHLKYHERTHTGEKPYECETCGKKYSHGGSLACHRRVHSGDKPYTCEACGKRFADQNYLKIHARVHTGEKPYRCEVCGKTFSVKGTLRQHKRVHSGEKPFSCQVCNKCFPGRTGLRKHSRVHSR